MILEKILDDLAYPEMVFHYYQDKGWAGLDGSPLLLDESTAISRRIAHTTKWCLSNLTNHQFHQIIFPKQDEQGGVQSRNFSFMLRTNNTLEMTVSRLTPYSQTIFTSKIETKLLDTLQDAVLLSEADPFDEPGPRIIYCNKAFESMTGYSAKEVIGNNPRMLHGPDTSDESKWKIRQALQSWSPIKQTMLNYKKNGDTFTVELNISPVADETGWYSHWVSIQRDLTQELANREAVRQNNLVLSSVGIGTWSVDLDSGYMIWDDRMFDLFDVDKSTFSHSYEDWKNRVHPDDFHVAKGLVDLTIDKEQELENDYRILTRDGRVRWIRVKAEIIVDPNNGKKKILGVNWDVTTEKESEEEIEKQRQIAVDNAKLASLGELAAGVGHEINNPLSIITLLIDAIEMKVSSPDSAFMEMDASIDKIRDACARIEKIVNGLRSVSNVQRKPVELMPLNLTNEVEQTVNMLQELYCKEDISVTFEGHPEGCFVMGDHAGLQQILVNLISNAKDAVSQVDKKAIQVEVKRVENLCRLTVKDSGEGILESVVERIFDPFVTSKEVGKGTGLGLSITKSLVEAANGQIRFNTSMGKGTTFTVEFPLSEVRPKSDCKPGNELLKPYRILVVEDDEPVAECLVTVLNMMNCDCTVAENGAEALSVLNEDSFDLILTDLKMPVLNGWELLEQLYQKGIAKNTPKYVMTGEVISNSDTQSKRLKVIADGIIPKPTKQINLAEILNSL